MRLVTQTEAAKHIKCSQTYVSRLAREGKIKRYKRGKVDLDELIRYKHGVDLEPPQDTSNTGVGKSQLTYAQAKTHREAYLAQKAKLEVEELMGKLVRKEDVIKDAQNTAAIVRTRLLAIPAKTAPYLVEKDVAEIKTILEEAITEALEELHRRQF